jgi:hypothetical protein
VPVLYHILTVLASLLAAVFTPGGLARKVREILNSN